MFGKLAYKHFVKKVPINGYFFLSSPRVGFEKTEFS